MNDKREDQVVTPGARLRDLENKRAGPASLSEKILVRGFWVGLGLGLVWLLWR